MVTIKLLVEGGKMTPGPAVAQQLGPMGVDMGKIINDINVATSDFKGINVPVVLDVDSSTKEFKIKVLSPPTSELLKKELGINKASGARLNFIVGDIAFERVIFVAKQKHESMLSKNLKSSVKSVLGTCQALGILVDNKEISEIMNMFNEGKFDAMIEAGKVEVDEEKKVEIETYFAEIKKRQDAEAAAKASAEANKK